MKILKTFVDAYGDEMTMLDLDDTEILPFSLDCDDSFKCISHFGGNIFDHTKFGSWEEYILNRHSPLDCYCTIFQQLGIEWEIKYPRLAVWWLLREDYPVLLGKLSKPTPGEIKTAIESAVEFIDGKTGGFRNDELMQAMKYYAVAVLLMVGKNKSAALEYIQKSKDIWSKHRKKTELIIV